MSRKSKRALTRKQVLVLALLLSIALFGAGLYSGLVASSVIQKQNRQEFTQLLDYVSRLKDELNSLQVEQLFIDSLDEREKCALSQNRFAEVAEQLDYYWKILPTRIETYEYKRTLTKQYQQLKSEYTKLSLRAWIIARDNYEKCHSNTIPVLYFYNQTCMNCSEQGVVLDTVKKQLKNMKKNVLVFTIDLNQDEPSVRLIRDYYNVSHVPALIINERVLQGKLFTKEEIIQRMKT